MVSDNPASCDGAGINEAATTSVRRVSDLPTSSSTLERSQSHSRNSSPAYTSFDHGPTNFFERSRSRGSRSPLSKGQEHNRDGPREIILQSFLPKVAVRASQDAEDLIRRKGFSGGLQNLLRPFGERLQGKVVIRDSVGASKAWEDFGIHFSQYGEESLQRRSSDDKIGMTKSREQSFDPRKSDQSFIYAENEDACSQIDELVEHYLNIEISGPLARNGDIAAESSNHREAEPQHFSFYLRKLLSSSPMTSFETFSYPVACIIAISSKSSTPIETLRDLYSNTESVVPRWVGPEYLRYYVLIHDEENDDIARSTVLFDQMKRHFGLHCHLLRLRSTQCVPTDDDSMRFPSALWLSAHNELAQVRERDHGPGDVVQQQYIFESDATAIRTFVREMVIQSIIPFMEGRVTAWNDQVASRRRGFGGRFMSISKRWTGFGSPRGVPVGTVGSTNTVGSGYDPVRGVYPPETAEAAMRRLADYAFMLRDWKLSQNVYDTLRADFASDKAWKYHAAASEMAAISLLLSPQSPTTKSRSESTDHLLETASYSYITRCSLSYGAIRCLTIAVELLRWRGGTAIEDAARWAARLLELSVLSPLAQSLLAERIAACHKLQHNGQKKGWGARERKAGLWSLLASDSWHRFGKAAKGHLLLEEASVCYGLRLYDGSKLPFPGMQTFWENLQRKSIFTGNPDPTLNSHTLVLGNGTILDEEREQLDSHIHRKSLSGAVATGMLQLSIKNSSFTELNKDTHGLNREADDFL